MGRVSVESPDPPDTSVTTLGSTDGTKPGEETLAESATLPWRPFRLVTVMVTDPEEPRRTGKDCALAVMLKSEGGLTVRVTVVE